MKEYDKKKEEKLITSSSPSLFSVCREKSRLIMNKYI